MRKSNYRRQFVIVLLGALPVLGGCGLLLGSSGAPVAVINAAPISGPPPLVVHFDAARSFAQTDAILMRYQWDLGDGSQAQGSQIDHIYGRKGAYQVRLIVTDDHGRSGTAGITISVGDLAPHAKIVASPPDGPAPLAVTFDGSGSTGPTDGPNAGVIVTYHWDFGDGTDADGVQPSHLYMRGGRFTATLTVTGAAGLADRASVDIRVLSFTKRPSQPVGRQPVAVVAADLDGDGRLDLAVANIASNDISILIQQPDGAFDQLGNIPVRHAPSSLVVADFDDDGIPDIASGSFETGEVSLVLGAGAGRFQPLRVFPAATAITALAVGDFNGDGHLDLAVADGPGSRVAILLGDGKGGFASPKYFPAGRWPSALIVGDFNGDGHLDLAVADFFGNTVSILLGDGKGNFSEPVETAVGAGPVSLATGDFDRDGRLDLAVANSSDGTLSILFGSGAGHFNQRLTIPVGSQVRSVVAADLNGDGRLDLIAANGGDDTISILLGDGNGSFPAAGQLLLHADGTPSGIAVGDFNRDGFPDFAVIRFGASAVTLFQNDL